MPNPAAEVVPGEVTLLDLLDRAVDRGVFLRGDLWVSLAGIDLLYIGLQAVVASASRLQGAAGPGPGTVPHGPGTVAPGLAPGAW